MNYLRAFATLTALSLAACSSTTSGACTDHVAALPDGGTAPATGCYLRSREQICAVDGSGTTCTDACAADEQSVVCVNAAEDGHIPEPDAALGCTVVMHPTPPLSQTYCCACSD